MNKQLKKTSIVLFLLAFVCVLRTFSETPTTRFNVISGTIKSSVSIDGATTVIIQLPSGVLDTILLNDKTKRSHRGATSTNSELTVNSSVIVYYSIEGKQKTALEIVIRNTPPPSASNMNNSPSPINKK